MYLYLIFASLYSARTSRQLKSFITPEKSASLHNQLRHSSGTVWTLAACISIKSDYIISRMQHFQDLVSGGIRCPSCCKGAKFEVT